MVRHIMADGREVEDIANHVVRLNEKTRGAYQMLYNKMLESVKEDKQ